MRVNHPTVGIVADDLTGAMDSAAPFASHGVSTRVLTHFPPVAGAEAVQCLNTATRDQSWADARPRAQVADRWVRELAPDIEVRKVDSALRGHVERELELALDARVSGTLALFAPSFPHHGRTVVDGSLRLPVGAATADGRPRDIGHRLVSVAPVHSLTLADVRDGQIANRLNDFSQSGGGIVVCDAETDDDLAALAAAGLHHAAVLWMGSAALTAQLAHQIGEKSSALPALTGHRGVLVGVGSGSEVAGRQVDHAVAGGAQVFGPADSAAARRALDAGIPAIIWAGRPAGQLQLELAAQVAAGIADAISHADALVLVGGETANEVLARIGVDAVALHGEVFAGIPRGHTYGALRLPVVTKAGSFGADTTLLDIIEHLSQKRIM